MKKQPILTLALFALSLVSCEPEVILPKQTPKMPLIISSMYPVSAEGGAHITIFGENFGASLSDNHITFDTAHAQVIQAYSGTVVVRVPPHLAAGDYTISLAAHEQTAVCPTPFKVVDSGL